MASNSQPSSNGPPPKPWEQAGSSSGPTPFKPPSPGSTSAVVESSGTANPGEIVPTTPRNVTTNSNMPGRPLPYSQQQTYGSTYGGGYNSALNSGYGSASGMYGSSYGGLGASYGGLGASYGGLGGSYGGGMYGNSMYRGGYGGTYGGSGMYGGGLGGGQMGGYGMGMGTGMGMGGPYGNQDPNSPFGGPPSPPGFWISFLRVLEGTVNFFGRIAMLIDQNTQAFHMFISAMLQLFDRSGMLYGELARFVLRMLGIRTKPKQMQPGSGLALGPHNPHGAQNIAQGPKSTAPGAWDNVWSDGPSSS